LHRSLVLRGDVGESGSGSRDELDDVAHGELLRGCARYSVAAHSCNRVACMI
jgi:hypothetical protein